MLALVLTTVFSAGFGLLIRTAQGMGANLVAVGATNYLAATAVNAALCLLGGGLPPRGSTVAIAVAGGFCYAAAFFMVYRLTRQRGASITGAVMRISTVVPVAFSLLVWSERLSAWQASGAALALASLPLLTLRPGFARDRGRTGGAPLLVGLFLLNGVCQLAPRAFRATEAVGEEAAFLAVLFATAAATLCTAWAVTERRVAGQAAATRPQPHHLLLDIVPGVVIGVCNALQNRFMVAALQRLPGTVVYPFSAAVGLVLTVAVSRLAWRERFGPLGTVGIALAGAAIVLVNLGVPMKVKASPEDFRVEEESAVELSDRPAEYSVYRLEKTSWDTFDLLDLLARRLGVGRQDITVAGLKDRHGSTSQFVAVRGLRGPPREVREANFSAVPAGWTDAPLSARSMTGNRFSLVLRDMDGPEARRCLENLAVVRRDGLPNYYDEQRFGSARHGGGFMGRELFLGRRERALRLYFTASKHDDRRTREMKRCVLAHWGRWRECLPLARGDSARVLERLAASPRAFRQALLALDRRFLVLVLNAYQSFLFNEVLAGLVRREAAARGFATRDLRYSVGSFAFPVALGDEARDALAARSLPVPGYDTVAGDDDVREVLDAVLDREGIGLADLRARQLPRISVHGVARPAWMRPTDLEAGEPGDDERYPGKLRLALRFSLPRGCYATLVVKRLGLAAPRPR